MKKILINILFYLINFGLCLFIYKHEFKTISSIVILFILITAIAVMQKLIIDKIK